MMYNTRMITCTETQNGYVFAAGEDTLAVGVYENQQFCLLHNDEITAFSNAMQAFVHLRSIHNPFVPTPKTMELFTTPARAMDNMSKWFNHSSLDNMPKEVFHANLPR